MDRSRRIGAKGRPATAESAALASPPPSSRLTLRGRKNRRRPAPLWSRVRPHTIADACGRALRRSLPAAIAAGAVLGVIGALWLGYRFVTTSSRYAITSIEIRGAHHLSADEVRAALPVAVGDNVFLTSPDEVARALRRHPWIAAATAERILPGTLVIEIREHEPAAVAEFGEPYLIGPDGRPFKRAQIETGEGADLPLVTGLPREAYGSDPDGTARTITAALAALARWRSGPERPAIGELQLGAHGTLTLRTAESGAAIDLGPLDADDPAPAERSEARGWGPHGLAPWGGAQPRGIDARVRAFDAVWAELRDDERERGRARSFHLGTRPDRVIVAFAKD